MSPAKPRSHGASNIGLQFRRLYDGKTTIREMADEETEFNRLNVAKVKQTPVLNFIQSLTNDDDLELTASRTVQSAGTGAWRRR